MLVFILNKCGAPLMPCSPRTARKLIKSGKAIIIKRIPFTIQLIFGSSGYCQDMTLGVDTGYKHIGIAVVAGNNVVYVAQINLRTGVSELLKTRRRFRRARRRRHTRYRQPRFDNRLKPTGWLPPSVKSKLLHLIRWITLFSSRLPKCHIRIEVGAFNVGALESYVKIDNSLSMSQRKGRMSYLVARERGKCQVCGQLYKKMDGWVLHHIWGSERDRPTDWALLHRSCHIRLHKKGNEDSLRKTKSRSYKESTYMSIIRLRLLSLFRESSFTYGNVTHESRVCLNLQKSHCNDAIAITNIAKIEKLPKYTIDINQFRKRKRSLHEATARAGKNAPNTTAKRTSKNTKQRHGYYLNDKVRVECLGEIGHISGFTSSGCYVQTLNGRYLALPGKKHYQIPFKLLTLVNHNNNWQFHSSSNYN